ncbi:MAG: amidohydrolase family protein [Gemmatimonadales bacterium]
MPRLLNLSVFSVFSVTLSAQTASPPPLAITHVTVIDVVGGGSLPNRTVLIRNGHIASIDTSNAGQPAGMQVLDGTGRYLIPGLWDMHVHVAVGPATDTLLLPLFTAYGITGIRDLGSAPARWEFLRRWRAEVATGQGVRPRLVAAGPMLNGPHQDPAPNEWVVSKPAEAGPMVDSVIGAGWDEIKVQDWLSPETFAAIARAARASGRPLVGHAPFSVGLRAASQAGMKSIEHLGNDFVAGMAVDCSSDEAAIRAGLDQARQAQGDSLYASTRRAGWLGHLLDSYDPDRCRALAADLAGRGVWQEPTIWLSQWLNAFGRDSIAWSPARLAYLPKSRRSRPAIPSNPFGFTPADRAQWARLYQEQMEMIALLRNAGGRFLAGSDTGPWEKMLPGLSLHEELERLVAAGFTPLEALQAATINPASCLGMADSLGKVAPGYSADLVLLNADPRNAITNIARIEAVIVRGRLVDSADRAGLLAAVARAADSL